MSITRFSVVENKRASSEEEVANAKRALRTQMKLRRAETTNRDVKEKRITDEVLSLLASKPKLKRVLVYLSFSSEVGTDELLSKLLAGGYEVYAPRVEGTEMVAVSYDADGLCLSAWGIREPTGPAYEGVLDAVVVPLLAVDKKGNRLGYGKGYFDKFLKSAGNPYTIGLAYDQQVIAEVPHGATDVCLDVVVTENGVYNR